MKAMRWRPSLTVNWPWTPSGSKRYDLVVTDLKMENVSGMDILREVNQLYPETKVIMLTAYATLDATIEAIRERIYDFFPKPVKIEELKKSVKKALGIDC